MFHNEWRAHPRRNAFLSLASVLCLVAIVAVVAILLLGTGGPWAWSKGRAQVPHSVGTRLPTFPFHLPTPSAATPPLGNRVVVTDLTPGATPCPAATPPVNALRPLPGITPEPAPTRPAAGQGSLTLCGNGQHVGPHCYTIIPGDVPTQDQVRQALYATAVAHQFSFSLLEAISWQESGWQQNVKACDGGTGLMQLQPETSTWLNSTYGTNDSPYTLQGNINQGYEMLNYLYTYYIPFCEQQMPAGQTCDWTTPWPGATDNATVRDIVISAYNEGTGTMANYGIINWSYVTSVTHLWQQFLAAETA